MPLMIEGDVLPDVDPELERLRARCRTLEREKADAELAARRAHEDADCALSRLRRQLSPLYQALQAVFGELDAAGIVDSSPVSPTPPNASGAPVDARIAAVWANWKEKLPGYPARIIDALLLHGELNTSQLALACQCKSQRISEGMVKLNKAALVNKNGGRFSLKQL